MRNTKLVVTVLGWALVVAAGSAQAGDLYELDTGRELAIGGTTLLVGGATWWQSRSVAPPDSAELAALDPADLPALDRFATGLWSPRAALWSDVGVITLGLSPLALLLETGDGMSSGELLAMYGEMIAMEQIAISALKVGVGRLRPLAYNDDPRIPDDIRFSRYARRSFPSGHTATAFAGAMFTSEVYARLNPADDARHWVRGGLLAGAALTGYLRVRSGNHFPTDILAGAVVGGVIGWAVPALHERDPDPVDPDTGRRAPGPTLAIGFGF
jgi:membrane-associated phospholipid phosphatase